MSQSLFVYGTLRPECAPAEVAALAARFEYMGEGWIEGSLYDLGEYPGAALDGSGRVIRGVIYRLPEDEALWRLLDAYEEYLPESPAASLFVRRRAKACLDSGKEFECWVYVYNRTLKGARLIEAWRK